MCEIDEMIQENPTMDHSPEEVTIDGGDGITTTVTQTTQEPIPGPEPIAVPEPNVVPNPVPEPDPYNIEEPEPKPDDELGSCDCRSECRYNTGHTYKYADYGYSG